MQRHNLSLDIEEEFLLIAIHSPMEAYKLAFLINKHLNLRLQRKKEDLDFFNNQDTVTYQIYEYTDTTQEITFYLLNNTSKTISEKTTNSETLFDLEYEEKTHYLVNEYKKADYLIKIITENSENQESVFLSKLSKIPGLITAYPIDQNKLKFKQNLNFD